MNKQPIIDKNAAASGTIRGRPRVPRQRTHIHQRSILIALLLLIASFQVKAGEQPAPPVEAAKAKLAELTASNFFSEGWNQPWTRRSHGEGTPDMSLLRVQTNFLSQLFRTDLAVQQNPEVSAIRQTEGLTGTFEYAFNRRFMLALIGNYRWFDSRTGEDVNGGMIGGFARVQLLDTASSSLAMTLRAALPSRDLNEKDTTISFSVAGWQDLSSIGLPRMGLYYHMQDETLAGPIKTGNRRNDLTYDVSLAKTWTSSRAFLANASTFVEVYGVTDLDGNNRGHTVMTLTPGFRATIANRHIFMVGVDFPLTEPNSFERIYRFTYIYCF